MGPLQVPQLQKCNGCVKNRTTLKKYYFKPEAASFICKAEVLSHDL